MEKEKISCEIIRDLLPLYCDRVCSENSRELIERHLGRCSDCEEIYRKMKEDGTGCDNETDKEEDESIIRNMAFSWKKSLKKSFLKGMLLVILVMMVLGGLYWGCTRIAVQIVPAAAVQAEIINESEDDIDIYLETTDRKKVLKGKTVLTKDGTLYIQFYRGVISVNNGMGENTSMKWQMPLEGESAEGEKVEITRICYGTETNHMLIWEKE